jgi:hypothetical protein
LFQVNNFPFRRPAYQRRSFLQPPRQTGIPLCLLDCRHATPRFLPFQKGYILIFQATIHLARRRVLVKRQIKFSTVRVPVIGICKKSECPHHGAFVINQKEGDFLPHALGFSIRQLDCPVAGKWRKKGNSKNSFGVMRKMPVFKNS